MQEPDNIKGFNYIVLTILTALYEKFPEPTEFKSLRFVIGTVLDHGADAIESKYAYLFPHTMSWLKQEGFLTYKESDNDFFREVTLTLKGIAVLGHIPKSLLKPKQTLWLRAKETVSKGISNAASDARQALVSEAIQAMLSQGQ